MKIIVEKEEKMCFCIFAYIVHKLQSTVEISD